MMFRVLLNDIGRLLRVSTQKIDGNCSKKIFNLWPPRATRLQIVFHRSSYIRSAKPILNAVKPYRSDGMNLASFQRTKACVKLSGNTQRLQLRNTSSGSTATTINAVGKKGRVSGITHEDTSLSQPRARPGEICSSRVVDPRSEGAVMGKYERSTIRLGVLFVNGVAIGVESAVRIRHVS